MRSKEIFVDSTKVMEKAFQNIMDEIIEHVIEGICFEAHRAVKLGYFPIYEYILKDSEFEPYNGAKRSRPEVNGDEQSMHVVNGDEQSMPQVNGDEQSMHVVNGDERSRPEANGVKLSVDIYGNRPGNTETFTVCRYCNEKKATETLGRHLLNCKFKARAKDSSSRDENNVDGNNSDGKKRSNATRQAKSTPNYETMSPAEKQDFLRRNCGVVSTHTGKPCGNSLNCYKHGTEAKEEIRRFIFASLPGHLADDNIDNDTVD